MISERIEMKVRLSFLIIAQFLDAIFTYVGIKRFGIEAEGNPIVSWAVEHFGLGALFFIKFLSLVFIIALYHSSFLKRGKILFLSILFWIYVYVVFSWAVVLIFS